MNGRQQSAPTIYIDIETIPCQREGVRDEIAATITPPGNYKKADTIAAWEAEQKPALVDEAYKRTSLQGHLGEIICICYAIGDGEVQRAWRTSVEDMSEATLVRVFWQDLRSLGVRNVGQWVGHNLAQFDLRFLYQRSIVHNIRPTITPFPPDLAPWKEAVFDTMTAWAGPRGSIKLDELCTALNISTPKDGIDGSQVWDFIQEGRVDEVVDYCARDVEAVREIHKRITFATPAPVGQAETLAERN